MASDQEIQFQVHMQKKKKVCTGSYSFLTGMVRMKEYSSVFNSENGRNLSVLQKENGG